MASLLRRPPSIRPSSWSAILRSPRSPYRHSSSAAGASETPPPATISSSAAAADASTTSPPSPRPDSSKFHVEPDPRTTAPPDFTLRSSTLNTYKVALAPTAENLKSASRYFTQRVPTLLYRAQNYRDVPGESPFPEVAFLGRSNVGKSSLFNTLLCTSPTAAHRAQHAKVSKKAGKTKMLIGYGIGGQGQVGADPSARPESGTQRNERAWTRMGRGGLVMVDMPGYGMASRAEWGRTAMEFLRGRKQLRRIFVLVDCSHRIKQKDVAILRLLTEENLPVTLVLSKVDKILSPGKKAVGEESVGRRLQKLQEVKGLMVQMLADEGIVKRAGKKGDMFSLDLLCVSAEKNLNGRAIGIDELRWSIMGACGIEVDG